MYITCKDRGNDERVASLVVGVMRLSRFKATVRQDRRGVHISCVRLKRAKPYCGQHPGPCLAFGRRHIKATYLEGLDWVGWNNLINDALDRHAIEADVWSYNRESLEHRYFVRRGRQRRVSYPFEYRSNFAHWTQGGDNCFADYCGKEPPDPDIALEGLDGTPGYPCYSLEEEDKYRAKEAEAEAA